MSAFVKNHVTRVFQDAGYELLEINGDRGGIVQGDGLDLVVSPAIADAARRFSQDPEVVASVEKDAQDSLPIRLSLYGGSASIDLEGVWLSSDFITFLKDECSEIYYKAQKDVNAIFDAEDADDREWNGQAYVGVVDEFAMEFADNQRVFVRVSRIADQSFDAYESGDEEADQEDAAAIIDGWASHGTIEVAIYDIDASDFMDGVEISKPFSPDDYDGKMFKTGKAERVVTGTGLCWPRDDMDASTLEMASELVHDEGESDIAKALMARAIQRGLKVEEEATPKP